MTRVGTGQSSTPLYRIHKNGKYRGEGGGGGDCCQRDPERCRTELGCHQTVLCPCLRLGETGPTGLQRGSGGSQRCAPQDGHSL